MSVETSLPSISFEGLDIKPRDTVRFITNFNEQQRRLTVFIGQLNTLAVSIDQEINQSQQAVSDAQQTAIDAISQSQQLALQLITTAISNLQGFLDSTNQSKDAAEEAASRAANDVTVALQSLVNTAASHKNAAAGSESTARDWAISDSTLDDDYKSSKAYAADAQQSAFDAQAAAAGDVIDDDELSDRKTYSSVEIEKKLNALDTKPSTAFLMSIGAL